MEINTMSKKSTIVFPAVLKAIIQDAAKDNPKFSRTDKQVRATLRAKLSDKHTKNTSWLAHNQTEYDRIRSAFDDAYATKLASARKRPAKSTTVAKEDATKVDA